MIELIPNMPDNVVGLKAIGKVTGEDYQNVVIPAVEAALKNTTKSASCTTAVPNSTALKRLLRGTTQRSASSISPTLKKSPW